MISGSTNFDLISINASVRSLYNKSYNCDKQRQELRDRIKNNKDAKPEYINLMKEKLKLRDIYKGCGYVLKRLVDKIDNIEYYTCLCKIKHPLFDSIYFMNNALENGIMPFSGGYLDQPAQIIEILQIYKNAVTREENIINEKQRKQNGKSRHTN